METVVSDGSVSAGVVTGISDVVTDGVVGTGLVSVGLVDGMAGVVVTGADPVVGAGVSETTGGVITGVVSVWEDWGAAVVMPEFTVSSVCMAPVVPEVPRVSFVSAEFSVTSENADPTVELCVRETD